jgi:hypothetical protein
MTVKLRTFMGSVTVFLILYFTLVSKSKIKETKGEETIRPPAVLVKFDGISEIGDLISTYVSSFAVAKKLDIPMYFYSSAKDSTFNPDLNISRLLSISKSMGKWLIPDKHFQLSSSEDDIIHLNCEEFNSYDTLPQSQAELKIRFISVNVPTDSTCRCESAFQNGSELGFELQMPHGSDAFRLWKENIEEVNGNKYSSLGPRASVAVYIFKDEETHMNSSPPIAYYKKAMELMENIFLGKKEVIFFVFSNDMQYVEQNLINPAMSSKNLPFNAKNVFYVSGKNTSQAEEFYLMSICKNIIISSDSSSWWAANFIHSRNKKENVTVMHPPAQCEFVNSYESRLNGHLQEYQRQQRIHRLGRYPAEWIQIEADP